ncbi:MAG: pilus assembly protein [Metallibacterium scheffleri]|jgi:Flp pilus assembly pilin Flp|uniref:pilus assembly protein n=1 Tax=Metallibacterium scheffleri TaxID=993689 RepID=UPI0026F08CF3|nr:pilus assembly protein [Metallibacterium scheffleri]MCK9366894.1 pilus assembly protein [Metallibacterium scheffleri]
MILKNRFQQRLSGRRLQRGQGMTEYIIIVALVAIAAIAVYSFFGKAVRGQMAAITSQLAGGAGTAGTGAAVVAQGKANIEATAQYNLKTYNTNASDAGQ